MSLGGACAHGSAMRCAPTRSCSRRCAPTSPGTAPGRCRSRSSRRGRVDDVQETLRFASEHRMPVVPRGAGTGLAGGAIASEGELVLSTTVDEPHPRDLRRRRARGRRARRAQRRPQRGARRPRPLVRARSRVERDLDDRRQHRHQRRRPALHQVRRHARGRARPQGRARRRPTAHPRPPHRQGRHRLRPHGAHDRLGGHARRHRRGDRPGCGRGRAARSRRSARRSPRSRMPPAPRP